MRTRSWWDSKRFAFLPVTLVAIAIFVLSAWPGHKMPEISQRLSDKTGHGIAYALLAFTYTYAYFWSQRSSNRVGRWCIQVLISSLIYGYSLELLQKWVFINRSYSLLDMLANLIGISIGIVLALMVRHLTKKR